LRERETEFDRRGVRIAAIGLGDRNYAKFFREETGITFPLLIDEERQAYRAAEESKEIVLPVGAAITSTNWAGIPFSWEAVSSALQAIATSTRI
jgi:hypothetical protein